MVSIQHHGYRARRASAAKSVVGGVKEDYVFVTLHENS